ncbi:MAG: peptidylprolyl isomerase, partial [Planctomycetota bacterium]
RGRVLTAGELDERLMEKARALRGRVQAGESFESVVRAESNDPAVRKDFGVYRDEQWRLRGAALASAVEQAELHVVQPPVKNSSGVDLFEVLARETTRLEDVRDKLMAELAAEPASLEEISALDRRLRAASRIEFP